MKFLGLISGGKDSTFNIMQCISQGHELIAIGNLYPSQEEADSYMFQSIGSDIIPLYEECMDVPLYRRQFGQSINIQSTYSVTKGDEVEDLYELLVTATKNHPDLQAISVGAILSSYQRVRVEHICSRLGLVSLAFLWNQDQKILFDDIVANLSAVVVKVAALGLDGSDLRPLGELRDKLWRYDSKFGLNVCGEGGEYETMTLDAPFFIKKIEIVKSEIVDENGVYFRRILDTKLIPKDAENGWIERLQESNKKYSVLMAFPELKVALSSTPSERQALMRPISSISVTRSKYYLSISGTSATENSFESSIFAIFGKFKDILDEYSMTFEQVVLITAFIPLSQFLHFNKVYSSFFGANPPCRVTVQSGALQLDLLAAHSKECMHVQGTSYWAPANIGPYSQSNSTNNLTFMSGVIGLVPHTMLMSKHEILQSLTSASRVAERTGSTLDNIMTAICYTTGNRKVTYPNCLWVKVEALPRGAEVEWQFILASEGGYNNSVEEGEDREPWSIERENNLQLSVVRNGSSLFITGVFQADEISHILSLIGLYKVISIKVFYTGNKDMSPVTALGGSITYIQCEELEGEFGISLFAEKA